MSPHAKTTRGKSEPVVYELQAKATDLVGPLMLRVITITLLITSVLFRPWVIQMIDWIISAVVFGSKRQLWVLKGGSIWGSDVQPDTQLVFLGVINKVLDYLVTNAIEHIALLGLTVCMTQKSSVNEPAGVYGIDFEAKEELLKPWIAITNFVERWRLFGRPNLSGRDGASCLRFFATLIISVCFLLQAAAMNTIGLPKARWYPDEWPKSITNDALMTLSTPWMNLTFIDWTNYPYTGVNSVKSGREMDSTVTLASASAYVTLNLLNSIYQKPPGWSHAVENAAFSTVINTTVSASSVQSVSVRWSYVRDIYNNAKRTGPSYARASTGMIGHVKLTVPMLTTTCHVIPATNISAGTILAQVSAASVSGEELTITIAPDGRLNFTGAHCNLRLQQVHFPLNFWLMEHSPMNYNPQSELDAITIYPASATEVADLRRLSERFLSMLPSLNGMLPGSSFAEQLLLGARSLKSTRPGFESEIDSLAPAVALVMQSLITTARWNMTTSATETVTSYPIRWYVYGSRPRLIWKWATGIVLSVLILLLFFDVYLILRYRVAIGPWLTLGGMLIAANAMREMGHIQRGCAGVASDTSKRMKYCVRDVGDIQAEITDDASQGTLLEKGKRYGELEKRVKTRFG
jgi:hypothetical protein